MKILYLYIEGFVYVQFKAKDKFEFLERKSEIFCTPCCVLHVNIEWNLKNITDFRDCCFILACLYSYYILRIIRNNINWRVLDTSLNMKSTVIKWRNHRACKSLASGIHKIKKLLKTVLFVDEFLDTFSEILFAPGRYFASYWMTYICSILFFLLIF